MIFSVSSFHHHEVLIAVLVVITKTNSIVCYLILVVLGREINLCHFIDVIIRPLVAALKAMRGVLVRDKSGGMNAVLVDSCRMVCA